MKIDTSIFKNRYNKIDKNKLLQYLSKFSLIDQLKFLTVNFEDNYPVMIKSIKYLYDFVMTNTIVLDEKYRMSTRLFWIFNNIKDWTDTRVQCEFCHKPLYGKNVQLNVNHFPRFCNASHAKLSKSVKDKYAKTCLKKYGVDHTFKLESIKQKRKNTWLKKYNVDNPSKSQEIKNKKISTNLKRHNVQWYSNSEKQHKTNLSKYGVSMPFQNKNIQKKCKDTLLKRTGHCNPAHGPGIQQKIKNTLYLKYNMYRAPQWKYLYFDQQFDSTWEIYFYQYYKDAGFNIIRNNTISFTYEYQQKQYQYFPDFNIDNKFFEIKGDHFFLNKDIKNKMICPWNRNLDEQYEAKHQCMIKNNVKIITKKDMTNIIKYIHTKYGKTWINQFKVKNRSHKASRLD